MNCGDFEIRLQELVENRQAIDDPALREHAQQCPSCQQQYADALLLARALGDWSPRHPCSIDLADRVMAELASSPPAPVSRKAGQRGWSVAALSSLAVIAASVLLLVTANPSRPNRSNDLTQAPFPEVTDLTESVVGLWSGVRESVSVVPTLSLPTMPKLSQLVLPPPPVPALPTKPTSENRNGLVKSPEGPAAIGRVMRDQFAGAFGFLTDALPEVPAS